VKSIDARLRLQAGTFEAAAYLILIGNPGVGKVGDLAQRR
jgi:hypothetical protein